MYPYLLHPTLLILIIKDTLREHRESVVRDIQCVKTVEFCKRTREIVKFVVGEVESEQVSAHHNVWIQAYK